MTKRASAGSHAKSINFDWIAEEYERSRGGDTRISAIAAMLAHWIPSTGVVLDVGAGPGALAAAIAAPRRAVLAVDLSQRMASRAATQDGLAGVLRARAEELPLADGSIDAALFIWVLNHVGEPGTAISEAARVLRRGGRLLVLSGVPTSPPDDELGQQMARLDSLRRQPVFDEGALLALARLNMFREVHREVYRANFSQSPAGLAKRIETRQYAHLVGVGPEAWLDFVQPVIDDLRARPDSELRRSRQNRHLFLAFERE